MRFGRAVPLTAAFSLSPNDAVGRTLPPHPSRLPWGEGALLAELGKTHHLVPTGCGLGTREGVSAVQEFSRLAVFFVLPD